MKRTKEADSTVNKTAEVDVKYVTQDQFSKLENTVNEALSVILSRLEAPKVEQKTQEVLEAKPDNRMMNPEWRKAVKEILGSDFECEVSYPQTGGINFTVIVPREKSNASKSHWESFKNQDLAQDRRTKPIGNSGLEGVIKWCELIKLNLKNTK